jgi:hypothetical protein
MEESFMHVREARRLLITLGVVGIVTALTGDAFAQDRQSGVQLTRDSRRYLISKDVGAERWAITFNLDDRTVTGNVFKTDGSPTSFIWCEITSETPAPNPADTQFLLDCFGSNACEAAPCTDDQWTLINTGIPISGSFMFPPQTAATFSGNIQPIFNARCAIAGCHTGDGALAQGLSLDAAVAYNNIVLRTSTQDEHFIVTPFDLEESHLYHKVTGELEPGQGVQMPNGGPPLSEEQIGAIRNWILEGAAQN